MLEHRPQAGADHRLVVDHHDPDQDHAARVGSHAWIRQPPSGLVPMRSRPPQAAARLLHADQPVALASPRRGRAARAVVVDVDHHPVGVAAQRHDRPTGPGVTHGVGERLLRDADSSQLDLRREIGQRLGHPKLDLEAGLADPSRDRPEVDQGRFGREVGGVAVGPKHPHRAPHGGQRLLGSLGDPPDALGGDLGPGLPHPLCCLRPDDDSSQVVGDDVVELTCDARALLGDDSLGLGRPQALELGVAHCEVAGDLGLPVHEPTQHHHAHRRQHVEEHPGPVEGKDAERRAQVARRDAGSGSRKGRGSRPCTLRRRRPGGPDRCSSRCSRLRAPAAGGTPSAACRRRRSGRRRRRRRGPTPGAPAAARRTPAVHTPATTKVSGCLGDHPHRRNRWNTVNHATATALRRSRSWTTGDCRRHQAATATRYRRSSRTDIGRMAKHTSVLRRIATHRQPAACRARRPMRPIAVVLDARSVPSLEPTDPAARRRRFRRRRAAVGALVAVPAALLAARLAAGATAAPAGATSTTTTPAAPTPASATDRPPARTDRRVRAGAGQRRRGRARTSRSPPGSGQPTSRRHYSRPRSPSGDHWKRRCGGSSRPTGRCTCRAWPSTSATAPLRTGWTRRAPASGSAGPCRGSGGTSSGASAGRRRAQCPAPAQTPDDAPTP